MDRWDAATQTVEEVAYIYNGANQLACVDVNISGDCDAGDIEYTYDAYGNLLDDGVSSYAYDAANRLIEVDDGLTVTTYTYNGDGDRVAQTVDEVETTYVLDIGTPLTMVLAETTDGEDTIYYLHGLDLVAQSDGTSTEYFTYDALGSVRQLADDSANPLLTQTYDPYVKGHLETDGL